MMNERILKFYVKQCLLYSLGVGERMKQFIHTIFENKVSKFNFHIFLPNNIFFLESYSKKHFFSRDLKIIFAYSPAVKF